ncbi:MAG: ABC transporter permease [Wenzhouxiangella sp.]|nr:ABC transporter permease [Wenzhouxiangella sp.]
MRGLLSDLRHAIKLYAVTPLSTALAIGALAAALAFVTVFASMWNDLALRPHPGLAGSERIITLQIETPELARGLAGETIHELDEQAVTLDGVVGIDDQPRSLRVDGEQLHARIELVSRNYFPVLRPRLHLGRALNEADHAGDAEQVAVVSYGFWRQHLGGRSDVLGETLEIADNPITFIAADGSSSTSSDQEVRVRIVGIMSRAMNATFGGAQGTDLWLALEPDVVRQRREGEARVFRSYSALGRLSPGSSAQAAADELNTRFADLAGQARLSGDQARWLVHPRITSNPQADEEVLGQVRLFLVASVLVAVVAAVNIGLFMLAQAPGRRREVNLRFALGASRRRIIRQLVTEAGVLVIGAAVLGLVASLWLSAMLQELAFLDGAGWREVNPLDWRVLLMLCAGVALLTAMAALAPAFGLRQTGIAHALRQVSARAGLAQRASGIAQVALAGLLGGAALGFAWQLAYLARADYGFEPAGIVVVSAEFNQSVFFGGSWEEVLARRTERRELLSALPRVEAVAFGVPAPAVPGFSMHLNASVPDQPEQRFSVNVISIDPAFPRLLGMRLLNGAMPQPDDPLGVLINERFAQEAWGHLDVLGEPVPLTSPMPSGVDGEARVVGVVADVAYSHPQEPIRPMVFTTAAFFSGVDSLLLKTSATPTEIRSAVEDLIDRGLIDIEIGDVVRLEDVWHELLAADRSRARLSITAALVAVFLAAFGFYGTQRYLVAAGRREYAIQAALGAGPRALRRLVLLRGLAMGLPGLVLGSLLAFIAIVWLRDGFLEQAVNPWVVSLLVVVGTTALILAACLGPARQALRMNPAQILREE